MTGGTAAAADGVFAVGLKMKLLIEGCYAVYLAYWDVGAAAHFGQDRAGQESIFGLDLLEKIYQIAAGNVGFFGKNSV